MSALDLDALERLTRAYVDAHATMLADARSAQAWLDDEAASKALAAHYGGEYTSPSMCVDVLALITSLRAAEARIERVGAILSDEGCDCYCDCDSDGHNADCDLCLACRIDREVSP